MSDAGRVIAGSARGTRLRAPGEGTRPFGDRVKQTLFAILEPDLPGANVLDLFAGSGAGGIEALSRGAAMATFVERLLSDSTRRLVSAASCSSAASGMAAFTSAATSDGTRAFFIRITRFAAGGRGSLAVSITVTSMGSLPSTISQPLPTLRRIRTFLPRSETTFSR